MMPGALVSVTPQDGEDHVLIGIPKGYVILAQSERLIKGGLVGIFIGWYSQTNIKSRENWQALVMVDGRVGWVFADEIEEITHSD